MRSKTFLLLLTATLFFVVPAMAQDKEPEKPKAPAPHLVIKALEHDFGEVKAGTPLTYNFMFENQGTDTLRVHTVKASCGCTTTKYDKVIAPEKEGEIILAIADTKNYQGNVVKSATVSTNDPDQPTFRLTLRANFKKE
ncbi:MAG TPA: DUF1573 domain-containing protein [bacterium]